MVNKNLKISARDLDVFRSLTKYHLTGQMIYEISQTFKNPFRQVSNTRARLGKLQQAGYLKRDQRLLRGRSNNENYYFLTKKSALLFAELSDLDKKSVVFNPVKIGRQAHSFILSEIMVKMERDIHFFNDICQLTGFIRENNIIVKGDGIRNIKPDGTIFLKVNQHNHLLFLEADLSTEVVSSVKPYIRTFQKKIEIYSEFKKFFLQNEVFHSTGEITGYRVIIICKSVQRLQNLLTLAQKMNKTNMFWFTTKEWIYKGNMLFDKIWVLPNGQFYPLF